VEGIFQKSLPVAWSVELFQFYLDYIRRRNDVFTGGELARTTIIQAYEFVISTIGLDKDSGGIWADYLDFVKSSQVLMNHFDFSLSLCTMLTGRRMRSGWNSKRWIRRGRSIIALCVFLWRIWRRCGKDTTRLKTILIRQLYATFQMHL
jgi:hypothetical protein